MRGSGRRTGLFAALLALWALCMVAGPWRAAGLPPEGSGFTRGLNRLEAVLMWQAAAAALALPLWSLGRAQPPGWRRWLSRLPAAWVMALVVAVLALWLWAMAQQLLAPAAPAAPPGPGAPTIAVPG